jgi:hypothetical protein
MMNLETPSIAESIAAGVETDHCPVTFDDCDHVSGPFLHGTAHEFQVGDLVVAGQRSNYQAGRVSNNVYFSTLIEPAVWAAELAVALTDRSGPGKVYVVEPTGPFEDDPNVTNKRFPGNPTRSYRSPHPLRVLTELSAWQGHDPSTLQTMLENLDRLRAEGLDVIED